MKTEDRYTFADALFQSAADKRRVLADWIRFFRHGLQFRWFTNRLYQHLTLHCGFSAHYDRRGFHSHYFEGDRRDTLRFLEQFDRSAGCQSAELGMTYWIRDGNEIVRMYHDINNAMVDAVAGMMPAFRNSVSRGIGLRSAS